MKNSKFTELMKKNAVVVLTLSGILIIAIVVILLSNRVDKKPDPQNLVDLNDTTEQEGGLQDESNSSIDNTEENPGGSDHISEGREGVSNSDMITGNPSYEKKLFGQEEPLDMDEGQGKEGKENVPESVDNEGKNSADVTQGNIGQGGSEQEVEDEGLEGSSVQEVADGGLADGGQDKRGQEVADGAQIGTGNEAEVGAQDESDHETLDGVPRTDTAPGIADGESLGQEAVETSGSRTVTDEVESGFSQEVMLAIAGLQYEESMGLLWPLHGEVVLNYSDDHLIYHKTLDQFRTHPAVAIAAEEGSLVTAAADGVVTSVEESAITGLTVTTAIGNEYCLVYGQLAETALQVGDRVTQGEAIGSIGPVSRFYHLEGDNLYFEVRNGEETVNPMSLFLDNMDDMDITSTETIESMEPTEEEILVDTVVEENETE